MIFTSVLTFDFICRYEQEESSKRDHMTIYSDMYDFVRMLESILDPKDLNQLFMTGASKERCLA